MNQSALTRICSGLVMAAMAANARNVAPHYQFTRGETNVFAVKITVRSETGSEITSGNVLVATGETTTNAAKLSCQFSLKTEVKREPDSMPGFYPGAFQGMMMPNGLPNDCVVYLNDQGHEVRDMGDQVLTAPLGKLIQSIYEPLPAAKAKEEMDDIVAVLDDPLWLGPAENFLNVRQNGQPWSIRYAMGLNQRNSPAALFLSRHTSWQTKTATPTTVEWHKQAKLVSFIRTGNEPRFEANSESDFVYDRTTGLPDRAETDGEVTTQTETTSRKAHVRFEYHRLTGAELAAALLPPPPPTPRGLAGADLNKIIDDLKSPDQYTRQNATRQLNGAQIDSPSDELINLVAGMALDTDSFVRMTAANFLGAHGTTNQVPVLLKLLKDTDWSSRQAATKALGRLKDERAIIPLTDAIAEGGSSYGQDASAALINIGQPAETAVLALLNERNFDTRRQACTILEHIGTSASLTALENQVGASDQSVSQTATEAIHQIKMRQ
jgi:hypothetical protein